MKKFGISIFLLMLTLFSCNEHTSIISPATSPLQLEKFYGFKSANSAFLHWGISSSTEATQLGLYRDLSPRFSYGSAVRLATIPVTDSMKLYGVQNSYSDTNVVNGTIYYYTLVAENASDKNNVQRSLHTTTISIPVFDYYAIPTADIIFSKHIQPIFSGSCAVPDCHSGEIRNDLHPRTPESSDFVLTSWASAMNGTDEAAEIVPFRASRSHMIHHLNTDTLISPVASPQMPDGLTFPTELRDVLIRWINNGARNDDGSVAHTTMPSRGWGYVTNQGEDLTAVIDLDNFKIARYITSGVENTNAAPPQSPHNVTVDWQNQYYYVNLIGGSKLLKFRVSDNAKAGELTTGLSSPAQIALSRNGDTAYVSNFEDTKKEIALVNTTTMTKIGVVDDQAMLKPHGMTITPDFKYVLVANSFSDNITLISTADNSVVKTIPISGKVPSLPTGYAYQFEPYQTVVTPDSKYAYVTCRKSGEVRVIDISLRTVIDSIKVGTIPLIPAVSPNGDYVFVTNRNSNSVSAIRTSTRTVEFTIADVGTEPHGISVSKDGTLLYVSCENLGVSEPPHHPTIGGKKPSFLKVIDISKRSVSGSLELGNFGAGVALTH